MTSLGSENREAPNADDLNKAFYSEFVYPWPPFTIEKVVSPGPLESLVPFEANGRVGALTAPGERARIWVAGCGANQAALLAATFPDSDVVGSDLSEVSLARNSEIAQNIGLTNLALRQESLSDVDYVDEFDYIVCTGVLHHIPDVAPVVKNLARALSRDGLLEVMVYNKYHRTQGLAVQAALKALLETDAYLSGASSQIEALEALIRSAPWDGSVGEHLAGYHRARRVELADEFLQPFESVYTVASLDCLLKSGGFELLRPAANQMDVARGSESWSLPQLEGATYALGVAPCDITRWEVLNHLMADRSPALWFFAQRSDAQESRLSTQQLRDRFLTTPLVHSDVGVEQYRLDEDGHYGLRLAQHPRSAIPQSEIGRAVLDSLEDGEPVERAMMRVGLERNSANVDDLRVSLASRLNPFLVPATG